MPYTNLMHRSGFSLIELIVATSLFILVTAMASTAILTMLDSVQQNKNSQTVTDELEFIMEDLTRNLRTGTNYFCSNSQDGADNREIRDTRDCQNNQPGRSLAFVPQSNASKVVYKFDGNLNLLKRSLVNGVSNSFTTLNSTNIKITDFKIVALGTSLTDNVQPHVVITISATDLQGENATSLSTGITQRKLDYDV